MDEMEYKKIDAFMRDDSGITSNVPSTIEVLSYCTVDLSIIYYSHNTYAAIDLQQLFWHDLL